MSLDDIAPTPCRPPLVHHPHSRPAAVSAHTRWLALLCPSSPFTRPIDILWVFFVPRREFGMWFLSERRRASEQARADEEDTSLPTQQQVGRAHVTAVPSSLVPCV